MSGHSMVTRGWRNFLMANRSWGCGSSFSWRVYIEVGSPSEGHWCYQKAEEAEETMESDSDEETPTSSRGQKRKSESQLADNEREKVRLPYSYASSSSPLMPHARLSPCPCLAQTPPQFTLIPLQPRSYLFPTLCPQTNVFLGLSSFPTRRWSYRRR